MSFSLPADVWKEIAYFLLSVEGRNGPLAMRAASKETALALNDSAPLWKEAVMTHFGRLFAECDAATIQQMTAAGWRRLLSNLRACGSRNEPVDIPSNSPLKSPLFWIGWGIVGEILYQEAKSKRKDDNDDENEEEEEESKNEKEEPENPDPSTGKFTLTAEVKNLSNQDNECEILMHRSRILFKFGINISTAEFWFARQTSSDGVTPLAIKVSDILGRDATGEFSFFSDSKKRLLDDEELIKSFCSIYPGRLSMDSYVERHGRLHVAHLPIRPQFISSSQDDPLDFFVKEHFHIWTEPIVEDRRRNTCYYKYVMPPNPLPLIDEGAHEVIHILVPLQDPEKIGFNEERIKFYQDQMRAGGFPTAVGLTQVYKKYRFADIMATSVVSQIILVSLIADGHHKIEAASRLRWPLGLLSISPHDEYDEYGTANEMWNYFTNPLPSWPLNRLEINRHLPNQEPHVVLIDNLQSRTPADQLPDKIAKIKKALSFNMSVDQEINKVVLPSSMEGWTSALIHGGYVEFKTHEAALNALSLEGTVIPGEGRITLQVPIKMKSEGYNLIYDPSTESGAVKIREESESDGEGVYRA